MRSSRDPVQAGVVAEVLARGQLAVEQGFMGQQADPPPHRPGIPGDLAAEDADMPGVGAQERRQDAQERRLARAVGAEHDQRGARRERQVDAAQGLPFAVAADEAAQLQHGRAHRSAHMQFTCEA